MAALMVFLALCAPAIHPVTAQSIVLHESGGHQFAIGVNDKARLSIQPRTEAQAVTAAKALIQQGFSIDMGYAQINSKNLTLLGISVEQVFDPCVNLRAMETILLADFKRNALKWGYGQTALQATLSSYNTGNPTRGMTNGYVQAVYRKARDTN